MSNTILSSFEDDKGVTFEYIETARTTIPQHGDSKEIHGIVDDGTLAIAAAADKSAFDDLTSRQAMWKFRRMFLTGVAASLGST
jgi:hypothetical protein